LADNLRRVANAQHRAALAAYGDAGEIEKLRQTIADADRKTNGYRAALDAGGDPALIAGWIAETTAIKKAAQARLGLTEAPPQRMTADQLDAIAEAFNDLLGLLRDADPRDRAELYSRLGLRMTYRPGPETLMAEVVTPAELRVFDMCPEGDLNPSNYPAADLVKVYLSGFAGVKFVLWCGWLRLWRSCGAPAGSTDDLA
jgi:hypothetical protein